MGNINDYELHLSKELKIMFLYKNFYDSFKNHRLINQWRRLHRVDVLYVDFTCFFLLFIQS